MREPPRDLRELEERAARLAGTSLSALAEALGTPLTGPAVHRKGKAGSLLERALGADAGSAAGPDFAHLGVELKTIPVRPDGTPRESTFVCSLPLHDADQVEWNGSPAQRKLAHVLWIPLITGAEVQVGTPLFWRPTAEQEAVLRSDFEEIVGLIAIGKVECLSARLGRWLQARPKAAHSGVRTRAFEEDGAPVAALPRGFYLRARFTEALLRDPRTLTGAD